MTRIALFSDKGSPGVTTLSLALATVWPRKVALIELDPACGDLALRLTDRSGRPVLHQEPGLLTLAAAARRDADASLWDHGQPLPIASDAVVVAGLFAPEQAGAMAGLWPPVLDCIAGAGDGDVIADLGRLDPSSLVFRAASDADMLIAVGRGEPAAILRLRDRLRSVLRELEPAASRRVVVVLVAEDRRSADAVDAMREVLLHGGVPADVAGVVALDTAAVTALHAGEDSARLQRSLLMRSVTGLAATLGAEPTTTPAKQRLFARSR
jgi:MinD-like ATPase involved in chromosome partitioning or flagellar assembly